MDRSSFGMGNGDEKQSGKQFRKRKQHHQGHGRKEQGQVTIPQRGRGKTVQDEVTGAG